MSCSSKLIHTIPDNDNTWRAIHLLNYTSDAALQELSGTIPNLSKKGVNTIILEVDYSFYFVSHPELRTKNFITKKGAREFAELCKSYNIRLFLQFQCLGHQSWAKKTFPLLTKYPHFDLTPGAFPNNEGLYCREWDPLNSDLLKIVYRLLGELIDAFQPAGMHVGMDEVFLLGSEHSPTTKGMNPAKLYAKAVNDMYNFIVKKRGIKMLMWGDRLIDGNKYSYGEWEASMNNTHPAIDMIPKDIIICDWHYELRDNYPSIPMFIQKGFKVLSCSWRDVKAAKALIKYSLKNKNPNMLGHLFTSWGKVNFLKWKPLLEGINLIHQ